MKFKTATDGKIISEIEIVNDTYHKREDAFLKSLLKYTSDYATHMRLKKEKDYKRPVCLWGTTK